MIKFRDSLTGVELLVADERKEEYLAAGYRLAAEPIIEQEQINPPEEPREVPEEKTEEKPKAAKKTKSSKKK